MLRFEGKISSSLLELQHLNYLDFSKIHLHVTKFPEFIGHLSRLKYLDFSGVIFEGAIPQQLGNLSELQHLDLRDSFEYSTNLNWLYTLHSLEYLDLTYVDLSQVTHWLPALAKVPSLRELHLRSCYLPDIILSSSHPTMNLSFLAILELSDNSLSPRSIYSWVFNLSGSISYVDLSWNSLQGSIPDAFRNMASLSYLDMSNNQIEGGIPRFFGNLSLENLILAGNELYGELPDVMKILFQHTENKLKYMDISQNRLNGSIPEDFGDLFNLNVLDLSHNQLTGALRESIERLSKIETLYLGSNHLEGIISEVHLFNLSMLRELDLSYNSFQFKISSGFVPPFQLEVIKLANCKQGPQFPNWLRTQHNFSYIDMSRAEISDSIPAWFWDLSSRLSFLNFSYNKIYGKLPDLTSKFYRSPAVDLSSNNLEGTLPLLPPCVSTLNLFQNRFSGSLESLCNIADLNSLDVSDNLLTGKFPDCFRHIASSLSILNLAKNNLSGSIFPVGPQCYLESLNLQNNSFDGDFPHTFRSCRDLRVIDLGENKLSGSIPAWIGYNWSELVVLSLRSNELHGELPSSICHMTRLQILDLSLNKISGTIPKCFNNLTTMAKEQSLTATITLLYNSVIFGRGLYLREHDESASVMWKGVVSEYKSTLGLVKAIDLSSNHLTGEVSIEITSLVGLFGLNLSRNFITPGFYVSLGLGFVFGFLGICGSLLLNKSWRHKIFKVDSVHHWLY